MKKYILFSFMFLLALCRVAAQDIPAKPNPPRLVNDFAKQLNPTEINALESKLVAYNDSTSSQIAIVVVPTTGEYPIADYALKLGRTWGVGGKGKNNGIVILWASSDRKIYISTGYGMEGAIPDAIAKRIITEVITPEFKNGMYYKGLDKGVDVIFKYATGEYKADPKNSNEDGEGMSPLMIFIIVFAIILFIIYRSKGGGGGGGGGGYRSAGGGGPIFWPYTTHSSGGSSSGNWGGGGFGGGSGGGFGGFGGGSFGGGGAGGDY